MLEYMLSRFNSVQLFVTPGTIAPQAPLSVGFSRQEHWSGVPFPSPGDLPNPGIKPVSPALQADSLPSEPPGKPRFPRCKWGWEVCRSRPSSWEPGSRQPPGVVSCRATGIRDQHSVSDSCDLMDCSPPGSSVHGIS